MARVLLADDDANARSIMARALASDGHTVTEAEDGTAALAQVTARPGDFDAIVTDLEMPGIDGVELAKRSLSINPALKVLLYSAHAEGLARAASLPPASVRSLAKPASLETLRAEIRTLVG